ncbi:hypothetical protein [Vibrio sp. H11]|uniref:DUF6950 family protein n=1 Tax=Vibrio sp. H11 TaxID=2565928 RepID=UPI0010A60234|nr:hypothetical protein [Vibrio sp. H11]
MRKPDWSMRLTEVMTQAQHIPFSWGEHDCCVFAAACSIAVCDIDPLKEYRGHYHTELGAKRALAARHGSLTALFDDCFAQIPPERAQRGDIVLMKTDQGDAAGVVWGTGIWAVTPSGVGPVGHEPVLAWRVE